MLEEVLTWLGVAGAAAFAWALYVFGESQPGHGNVKAEEQASSEE